MLVETINIIKCSCSKPAEYIFTNTRPLTKKYLCAECARKYIKAHPEIVDELVSFKINDEEIKLNKSNLFRSKSEVVVQEKPFKNWRKTEGKKVSPLEKEIMLLTFFIHRGEFIKRTLLYGETFLVYECNKKLYFMSVLKVPLWVTDLGGNNKIYMFMDKPIDIAFGRQK